MADLLADALAWLSRQRKAFRGVPGVYRRGDQSAPVLATLGHTGVEIDAGNMASVRVAGRKLDVMIEASELAAFGVPRSGDRIELDMADGTTAFEVAAIAGGEVWRYTDAFRRTFRIHTKDTGAA